MALDESDFDELPFDDFLKPGDILVAAPEVDIPYYQKSVVLLTRCSAEMWKGIVLNGAQMNSLLLHPEKEPLLLKMNCGGPVIWAETMDINLCTGEVETGTEDMMYAIRQSEEAPSPTSARLCDDAYIQPLHSEKLLELAEEQAEGNLNIYFGCVVWSPKDQLHNEIKASVWGVLPFDKKYVFSEEPDKVWENSLNEVNASRPKDEPLRYTPNNMPSASL